jgi:hypothetical protein
MLDLRHAWADGTTRLVFEPLALVERLAALTPRPRINLLFYYGVLGARSAWRSRLRESAPDQPSETPRATSQRASPTGAATGARTNWLWAELMRSFGVDVLACVRCGGRLSLIALIEDPRVIRRILSHLRLPTEVPGAGPARPPPLDRTSQGEVGPGPLADPWYDDDVAVP